METGKALARLHPSYKPIYARIVYDRQILMVLDSEHVAHLWKLNSPNGSARELFQVNVGGEGGPAIVRASVSPEGKYISITVAESHSTARVEVYEIATGKPCAVNDHTCIWQPFLAFSPDGKYRIWADVQQNMHFMEGPVGKEIRVLKCGGGDHEFTVFSPDGSRLVTATITGITKLWDVETGSELMTLWRGPGPNRAMSFSHDGAYFGALTNGDSTSKALIWDARPLDPSSQQPRSR